eukprot:1194669-Prorocentrum_minimum.AAC.7
MMNLRYGLYGRKRQHTLQCEFNQLRPPRSRAGISAEFRDAICQLLTMLGSVEAANKTNDTTDGCTLVNAGLIKKTR